MEEESVQEKWRWEVIICHKAVFVWRSVFVHVCADVVSMWLATVAALMIVTTFCIIHCYHACGFILTLGGTVFCIIEIYTVKHIFDLILRLGVEELKTKAAILKNDSFSIYEKKALAAHPPLVLSLGLSVKVVPATFASFMIELILGRAVDLVLLDR